MRSRLVSFAAVAVFLCSAAAAFADPAALHNVTVTDADNGHTVSIGSGDTMTVSLSSTPGTGYSWQVRRFDSKVLTQMGKPRLIHSAHPMPGAPATQVFRFSAAGAGSTGLELDYVRPWEKGTAPARVFRLDVTVH